MDADEGEWRFFKCPTKDCGRVMYLYENAPKVQVFCGECCIAYEITKQEWD